MPIGCKKSSCRFNQINKCHSNLNSSALTIRNPLCRWDLHTSTKIPRNVIRASSQFQVGETSLNLTDSQAKVKLKSQWEQIFFQFLVHICPWVSHRTVQSHQYRQSQSLEPSAHLHSFHLLFTRCSTETLILRVRCSNVKSRHFQAHSISLAPLRSRCFSQSRHRFPRIERDHAPRFRHHCVPTSRLLSMGHRSKRYWLGGEHF